MHCLPGHQLPDGTTETTLHCRAATWDTAHDCKGEWSPGWEINLCLTILSNQARDPGAYNQIPLETKKITLGSLVSKK